MRLLIGVLAICVVGAGVTLVGNDYRLRREQVSIPVANGTLDAVLGIPSGEDSVRGLVVVLHGDGPVDATHDGLYLPWFEAAADVGYATVSWSKPGVGESSGSWLDQTMDDRAAEVSAVIDWAKRQPGIVTDRIVLWGASQAGWVLPKVVSSRDDIDAVVAVGPAINWLRQGRYHLVAELDDAGAEADGREAALRYRDQRLRLLEKNADYETYLAGTDDPEPMERDRWGFVLLNYTADATADLTAMSAKDAPVLLMLGEHDRNVDVDETAEVYARILGEEVTINRFPPAHSMARPVVEDSVPLGFVTAVGWPRALFADGVLATYRGYLRGLP